MPATETLIAFSHLRWDFVYQRPQHLLSRFAAKRRVFYIEEPIYQEAPEPSWERLTPAPNVCVLRPHTPLASPGFNEEQIPMLKQLVAELIETEKLTKTIAWLYTPLALPLAQMLTPQAVVYDCMDELSLFLNAPPELLTREAELFRWADLVFTGGPSLYQAKKTLHPQAYCFPSSVEAAHFQQARPNCLTEAPDQAPLPHPRLGFYGVLDERLDLELLPALADAHPEWQIILIGPVVKIDPANLPRRPNLHYLGPRDYKQLPAYVAGWEVCLLPFARNAATRFISPTKTLEYMAAERMIVSTPIKDVAEPYGDIVYLGDTAPAFIAACEEALAASVRERTERITKMRAVVDQTSWQTTVRVMEKLMARAIERRQAAPQAGIWSAELASSGKHVVSVR
jgi:UDP-galactopyranose mutase